jgi:hypothetical protein
MPLRWVEHDNVVRKCFQPKACSCAGSVVRLDAKQLARPPALRDPGEQPATMAADVHDPPRWLGEAITAYLIDHRRPEHLVPQFEVILIDATGDEA